MLNATYQYKQSKDVIPAKAGIQSFIAVFVDSCLRRSDSLSVPLIIQTSIKPVEKRKKRVGL